MSLRELRAYRRLLVAEEDRVSYWRRVVQARIDVLEGDSDAPEGLSLERLSRALGDTASGVSRRALSTIGEGEPLPELPALESFWQQAPEAGAGAGKQLGDLRDAERQLSEYRAALHGRLDSATRLLVERYRDDPLAALELLS
jgi:hypothetical protein